MDGRFSYLETAFCAFTLEGIPVPKGRPRGRVNSFFSPAKKRTVNTVSIYTPAKTLAYEKQVAEAAKKAMGGRAPTDLAVSVSLLALFPIPKQITRRRRADIKAGFEPCLAVADLDNIEKAVNDAMNGIVFVDDRQIIQSQARKDWADTPRIVVKISTLTPVHPTHAKAEAVPLKGRAV